MNDIFLRSVELSNFRIYGERYAFEFPEGPGVTLITGANGLGKTSFFDAVEWALTSQVGRFSDIPHDARRKGRDPLTRVGAPQNSHRVSLAFSDGAPIDRGAGFLPPDGSIARLLKQPDWPAIGNLHGYLSITHFLGQSSTRRFSLRDPKSQWEALKGPAGVDRINLLRERVSGQGARRAFTRAIRDRVQRLETASGLLDAWRMLLDDRDRLARLSSSERSFSPAQVLETVERLAQEFLPLVAGARWVAISASGEPEGALNQLAALLGDGRLVNEAATARAAELERLCGEYAAAGDQTTQKSRLALEITDRRTGLIEQLSQAETHLATAATALSHSEQRSAQIQARAASLARVSRAMEQLERSRASIEESQRQLGTSQLDAARAESRLVTCQSGIDAANARRAERNRVSAHLESAKSRTRLSAALRTVRMEIQRLKPLADGLDEPRLRGARSDLTAHSRAIGEEIVRLTTELRSHDARIQTLAEAVARIAHQLTHDDLTCPVCSSLFEPGELRSLALANSAVDAAPAAELGAALAAAKVRQEENNRQMAMLDLGLADYAQLTAALTAEQDREAGLMQQLVEAGGSVDTHYDDSSVVTLGAVLDTLDREIAEGPSQEALDAALAEAQAAIEAERIKRVSLERTLANASSDLEVARSLLSQHPELWSAAGGLLVPLAQENATAQSEALAIGEQLRTDQKQLDDARIARDAVAAAINREDASLATINGDLDALAARRKALVDRWNQLGQTGDPDNARVAQLRSQTAERQARAEPIAAAHTDLINGLRIWQNDQQLQQREQAIAATILERHAASEAEATTALQTSVAQAQAQLDIAQRARDRMEDVGVKMQTRAEEFAEEVLEPLNDTIQRFSRTLMTWSDASIIYRAEHHATRSELRPAVIHTDADGTTSQLEINPNYFFSEGQLSALSVSALLAASTTFSWSRWRGLLLDDPLQHNDIIHASAFMDLLRQMVRELGYQVILSTHDSSEAEFLARKCRSAGIPFAVHELVPRGDAGLVSAVA
ncbi:AAA family ATPase [Pseudorhizobium pelagicum]|uniref:Chromosome segregation protein SMC n=1 Tax=Pseudorhizobium pelagicum TaxID=1509405 RepID=A0A922T9G4_9HYPH|nr:AAA family ATPase [Pseudorhizobium pelagicum]KEQ06732.1 chromosome segregation protein SMC [Pseudorhizobium pelagicum]KEQ08575.1 chromosome segregation protein SMC [Pseudorhizobium pelagicum]